MSREGHAFDIEECHIPSFNGHGMTLTGDYFVVRRAEGPLKGYPLLVTGHQALALFFASVLSDVGEEEVDRRWVKGEFKEFDR